MTRGRDLRATTPAGRTLQVQVKTSTVGTSQISWQKPGDPAREWSESAKEQGDAALFVFVHFPAPAAAFDLPAGTLTVSMPEGFRITAATAEQFADDVDAARASYGQRTRQLGPKKGERLNPDKLRYPVFADDYPTLDEVMASL